MTECSRCGDCCDPVTLSGDALDRVFGALHGHGAPGGQLRWIRRHWKFLRFVPARNGFSAAAHFACDFFDRESRTCTAYDERPKVCQGYPWYGQEPTRADNTMGGRCSFLADVPGIVMLPIVEVRHSGEAGASSAA